MNNKKAQVTIFIIIAIVIVGAIILFFTFKDDIGKTFGSENEALSSFVENCIEKTGKDAIYNIGQKGGYFYSPKLSTSNGIPYYYYEGDNEMHSKEEVEKEISTYLNEMLTFCTGQFEDFPGLNITSGEVNTKTTIESDKIMLDVTFPLTVISNNKNYIIENFNKVEILIRVDLIYDSIEELIKGQLGKENICLSCITKIALKNDLKIDMTGAENATFFTIKDEHSKINGIPLEWKFANKY